MKKNSIPVLVTLMCVLVVVLSLVPIDAVNPRSSDHELDMVYIRLRNPGDIHFLVDQGVNILHRYDSHVLVELSGEHIPMLEHAGLIVDPMHQRTTIHVRGTTFDFTEGEIHIPPELRVDDYANGETGQYIVHMLGPIASVWRETLEDMGVEIMHYMSNHAYRVLMTPEIAGQVEELGFVDWVGFYHPYYKIQPGLESGRVQITTVPGAEFEVVNGMNVHSVERLVQGSYMISGEVFSPEILYEIARSPSVDHVAAQPTYRLHGETVTQLVGGGRFFFDDEDGNPETAYRKHGEYGSYINQLGHTGNGVITAIVDSGIGDGSLGDGGHADFTGRIVGRYSFDGSYDDGYGHGTQCAGLVGADTHRGTGRTFYNDYYYGQGGAPETEFFSIRIFDNRGGYIGPEDLSEFLRIAKQEGNAYVHSNSWGSEREEGMYDTTSSMYDRGARDSDPGSSGNQPMVITVSAGNGGSRDTTLASPATGKNVIAVGGTDSYSTSNFENVMSMSSRGWTQDNRVKPDVVAPGNTASTSANGGYSHQSGTSFSNPTVAGAAAVTVEWYEKEYGSIPSPAMVKALIINTANDLDPVAGNTRSHIPNQDEGWGMVDISKLQRPHDDPIQFFTDDQTFVFTDSGQMNQHTAMVDREGEPLKISLVWTDNEAPGSTETGRSLINDLDLEVESPSGLIYRGNAFSGGWTQAGENTMSDFDSSGDGWDDSNNVENVYIHPDEVEQGMYTIRVIAREIGDDGVNLGYNSQDYALVAYNALKETPGDPPEITLLSPQGGETLMSGEETEIRWSTVQGDDPIDSISLYYSVDSGQNWISVEPSLPDTGSHDWIIPNEHSMECLFRARVRDISGRTGVDMSGVFSMEGTPPGPPSNLKVEHHGSPELVTNGVFGENYEPWVLTRVQDQGEARWDSEGYLEGGSIHVRAEAKGEGTSNAEESYWEQTVRPTTHDITLEGAFRKNLTYGSGFGWETRVHSASVEIFVRDSGNWQTLVSDPDISFGDTGWTPFEPVVYQPQGVVDAIRILMHGEAEGDTGPAGGEHTALVELWVDQISMITADATGTEDNLLTWDPSADDPGDVSHYNIYRSQSSGGPWDTPLERVYADGSHEYQYVDPGAGTGDDVTWWYVVRAVGINGLEEKNTVSVPEPGVETETFDLVLHAHADSSGWNFVSFNLNPTDASLESILESHEHGISGNYDRVVHYDASSSSWVSYVPGRPERFNTLGTWDHSMGVWIRMTGDDVLTVEGTVVTEAVIMLEPGWNMVGIPSHDPGNHGLPSGITTVGYFDPSETYNIGYTHSVTDFVFEPGNAYWIFNDLGEALEWRFNP